MSYLNEKTLDIVLEEYSDFGYQLHFTEITEECTTHPVSGELINCKEVSNPLPVNNLQFAGSITDSLGDNRNVLANFTISMLAAAEGTIELVLDKATVKTLAGTRPANATKRIRELGYYDLICYDPDSDTTSRVMEGQVYVSDGVTE